MELQGNQSCSLVSMDGVFDDEISSSSGISLDSIAEEQRLKLMKWLFPSELQLRKYNINLCNQGYNDYYDDDDDVSTDTIEFYGVADNSPPSSSSIAVDDAIETLETHHATNKPSALLSSTSSGIAVDDAIETLETHHATNNSSALLTSTSSDIAVDDAIASVETHHATNNSSSLLPPTSSGIAVDDAIASVENQSHSLPSISLYNIKCSFCHVSSFEKKRDNEGKVFRKKSSFNSAVQCSRCHSYACWDCIDLILKKIPTRLKRHDNWCRVYGELRMNKTVRIVSAPFCNACEFKQYSQHKVCISELSFILINSIFMYLTLYL